MSFEFWNKSLTTLWWDAPPFAWLFFVGSILLSIFLAIKKRNSTNQSVIWE